MSETITGEVVNEKTEPIKEEETDDNPLSSAVKIVDVDTRCHYMLCKRLLRKNEEAWYYLDSYYCSANCLLEGIKSD